MQNQLIIKAINMRKFKHKKLFKITRNQIESIEREYWLRYNNNTLKSVLYNKQNT